MEQVEVVPIADTRNVSVEASSAKEAWFEVVDGWYPAKIRFVDSDERESSGGCSDAECYGLTGGVV